MAEIRTFRDLHAWQAGMDAVALAYELTADFPRDERFGLVSQMRRASLSITSNVAKGQAVGSARWTLRYINTAIGSATELESQIEVAIRLRFVAVEKTQGLRDAVDRVQKLLYGMRRERRRRLGISAATTAMFALMTMMAFW